MKRKQRHLPASVHHRPGGDRSAVRTKDTPASTAAALAHARQLMRAGRLAEAQAICQRILAAAPRYGYATHLMGVIAGRAGDLTKALKMFQKASASLQREPAVFLDLAAALQGLERYEEALQAYRHAVGLKPDLLQARMGEGNVLRAQRRYEDAETAYRKAIALAPNSATAYASLGLALKELERDEDAIHAFSKAVTFDPKLAEAYSALGILLWRAGKAEEALNNLSKALAVRPDYLDVHAIIGRLLLEQERGIEAEAPFRKLLELRPQDLRAHEGLAQALDLQGLPEEAEVHLRRSVELDGAREGAHKALIENLAKQDRMDEAHAACETALKAGANPATIHAIRADLYLQQGRRERAIEAATLAQSLDPEGLAGLWPLTRTRKLNREDDVFKALQSLAARPDELPADRAITLEFALSKAFQDVGDYDRAFRHLHSGNSRKREEFQFDIDKLEQAFRSNADAFDSEYMDRMSGGGDPSDLPIFIVGMPRSGTTLTEQILASHPAVHGAGELNDFAVAATYLNDPERPPLQAGDIAAALSHDSCTEIGRRYVELLRRRDSQATRITDKMLFNFVRLGLIHLALPNAKIIHCVRDPVDTCLSCYQQLFKSANRFAYDLTELGRYHRSYERLMEHWQSVLPADRIFNIRYEDLVADFEHYARRLVEHCDLPWDEACLAFHRAERQVRTASVAQVRQPIYNSSVAKWRRYERHLRPLIDTLSAT